MLTDGSLVPEENMALVFFISFSKQFPVGWLSGRGCLLGPGLRYRGNPMLRGWEASTPCAEPRCAVWLLVKALLTRVKVEDQDPLLTSASRCATAMFS